jgi:hypothetical protein
MSCGGVFPIKQLSMLFGPRGMMPSVQLINFATSAWHMVLADGYVLWSSVSVIFSKRRQDSLGAEMQVRRTVLRTDICLVTKMVFMEVHKRSAKEGMKVLKTR